MTIALELDLKEETLPALDLKKIITRASAVIAPVWPINTFIACNPLQGLEELPFDEAIAEIARYQNKFRSSDATWEAVQREMIKWTSTYLDEGQSRIPMPGRERGFYAAFKDLARFDSKLVRITNFPEIPSPAIEFCLNANDVPVKRWEEVFKSLFATLPGWAGHVKWREQWDAQSSVTLVDFMAVYLLLADLLGADLNALASPCLAQPVQSNLLKHEADFRQNLVAQLQPKAGRNTDTQRADAQFVFCIDVRSEPFRRKLEAQGNYQTVGFAGFFGLPVAIKSQGSKSYASCPVLLRPRFEVCEQQSEQPRERWIKNAKLIFQSLKYNAVTPFALVELLGPWLGLTSLLRTLAPSSMQKLSSVLAPKAASHLSFETIPFAERASLAENALRGMSLTQGFARLVVFCGHGSTTTNNAYAAALNCGACGGHHGGPNARILAAILNQNGIRAILRQRGLLIPEDTVFLAAEHDTTTGHVELYPDPAADAALLAQLKRDLEKAGHLNLQRSADWAQPRPEWGLARNAAFIVGPRELTRNIDLEGRCFLHSYDSVSDEDGTILNGILTAPMVVAQWINSQYLFSTLDNVAYGSGSKITKNIVGKIGVMQGNASDLMHGLPLQSVFAADDRPYHEPLRLLTVVYAPRERVQSIIDQQAVLQKLFFNQWVTLVVIDPQDEASYRLEPSGAWTTQI